MKGECSTNPGSRGAAAVWRRALAYVRLQWIPLSVLVLWGAGVYAAWAVSTRTGVEIPTCMFRRVTGVPCATCGATRCTMHLLHGRFGAAFEQNPFVTVLLLLLPGWVGLNLLVPERRPLPARARAILGAAALALLAANWAYVIRHESRAGGGASAGSR